MIPRDELCSLIPHAGSMCLLDGVEHWDQTSIRCSSKRHLLPQNPLRMNDQLTALHAVEYAAQAMAVHGGLLAREQGIQPVQGFIAGLRDIRLHVDYLHEQADPLRIEASALLQDSAAMIYQFQVAAGDVAVADGRITVMAMGRI